MTDINDASWKLVPIPGGTPKVHMAPLGKDGPAFTALVRFPAGWERPETGHYDAIEEILWLAGRFEMNDHSYRAGDHAWVPAGATRAGSSTSTGALALAWFSQPNKWTRGTADNAQKAADNTTMTAWTDLPAEMSPLDVTGRCLQRSATHQTWILDSIPDDTTVPDGFTAIELFDLAAHRHHRIDAAEQVPVLVPGPVWARLMTSPGDHQ